MNSEFVDTLVQDLGTFPGVEGCALVEVDTGMAWHHGGNLATMERVGEAAIEFWRVQVRLSSYFTDMGPLQSAAYSFSNGVIALFPVIDKPALVLVCVAAKNDMAWKVWAEHVMQLKKALMTEMVSTG